MIKEEDITREMVVQLSESGLSSWGICRHLYGYANGNGLKNLYKLYEKLGVDKEEIKRAFYEKQRKWEVVSKDCPVCGSPFQVRKGSKREKTTCSHACSNTFFNGTLRNKDENLKNYKSICFRHHAKKCVVCEENRIVEVHHLDGNKYNNNPENLIPLCPNHHQYWHSRYRHLVVDKVMQYVEAFKKSKNLPTSV